MRVAVIVRLIVVNVSFLVVLVAVEAEEVLGAEQNYLMKKLQRINQPIILPNVMNIGFVMIGMYVIIMNKKEIAMILRNVILLCINLMKKECVNKKLY